MADTKISALTAVATPAGTDEYATNQGAVSKRTTLAQVKTFVNTAPVFAAGTASAGTWPLMTAGTLLTTAEDGAFEMDGTNLYFCTDAGNRGIVPVEHIIRANATRTFTSNTSEQAIFNSPANGAITLETGVYLFEGLFVITGMSSTSGNAAIDPLGAGTATCGQWLWHAIATDATTPATPAAGQQSFNITQQSSASIATAGTGTALGVKIQGTVSVTGAGTMIPGLTMVTAAAAVVSIGSYFNIKRIGATGMTSVGQWT